MEVRLREVESIKKDQNLKFLGIEVVLLFNDLEELKGFQLCCDSTVLRVEGSSSPCSHTPRGRKNSIAECANTLKKNRSMITSLSYNDKKSDYEDDEEDTETLAFNVIIDLEDTSMHNDNKDDSDDDSIYSDEEVSNEELQNKHSLLYTKWVGPMELHQNLNDILKKIQEQKETLEERNYELIARSRMQPSKCG
ncbi:hypothetical protein M9H77_06450 [Catharanthus roseus]|uniref:Uncharacterized protein n=1 Tax=Catharanthus roseus TaxID=4058 RepID=A0ACC0BS47_CATRO|nr:hypothetical protein M9H77_06450 [Catharanthus roseus]